MKDLYDLKRNESMQIHFQMGRLGGKECSLKKLLNPCFPQRPYNWLAGLKTKEYRRWSSETSNKNFYSLILIERKSVSLTFSVLYLSVISSHSKLLNSCSRTRWILFPSLISVLLQVLFTSLPCVHFCLWIYLAFCD